MRTGKSPILLAILIACTTSGAQAVTPDEQMKIDSEAQRKSYPKMPDTPGTGAYPAVKTVDPAFPGHVIYRPANLPKLGARKLPVVVWGNGGCRADGASARLFLAEIASHGYLAIAPGTIQTGPGAPAGKAAAGSTTSAQVHEGIGMALAANASQGRWKDRIDVTRIAAMGYSCGGLQALHVAADPRIGAVVILHSGIFLNGRSPTTGEQIDKSLLLKLHTPVLYIQGGPMDVAYENGIDDVARIEHVPVMLADHDVHHVGTFAQPNGGSEARLAREWLDWQLLGDRAAAKSFVGADCRLCTDKSWTITRKRID